MQPEPIEPEVFEGELDNDQLEALFSDLEAGAEILTVLVRTYSDQRPPEQTLRLTDAQQLLRDGVARAVQIRYRFEQQIWSDTLMVLPHAVRVIRTRISEPDGC